MGATWRTFAVRHANELDVRTTISSWLAAKGFEPAQDERLFPFDTEHERGVVLSATSDWVTIAFSHAHQEGDRLVFELKKLLKPLLEIWVYDSDIWGYRLYNERALVASFNSHPKYFGGPAELELPRNGDPELVCELCQLPIDPKELARLQQRWAVFSENTAHRFATAIGAEPSAFDYDDFSDLVSPLGRPITVGKFTITQFVFERADDRQRKRPRLHDVVVRTVPLPKPDPELEQWQKQMQRHLLPVTLSIRALMWCLGLVMWLVTPFFVMGMRWKAKRQVHDQEFLRQLMAIPNEPDDLQNGNRIINRQHGCSIELSDTATWLEDYVLPTVFSFQIDKVLVRCRALRPSQLVDRLRFWPGAEILEDRKYFVGELPARTVLIKGPSSGRSQLHLLTRIETSRAVYSFEATGEQFSGAMRQQLAEIVESFKIDQV